MWSSKRTAWHRLGAARIRLSSSSWNPQPSCAPDHQKCHPNGEKHWPGTQPTWVWLLGIIILPSEHCGEDSVWFPMKSSVIPHRSSEQYIHVHIHEGSKQYIPICIYMCIYRYTYICTYIYTFIYIQAQCLVPNECSVHGSNYLTLSLIKIQKRLEKTVTSDVPDKGFWLRPQIFKTEMPWNTFHARKNVNCFSFMYLSFRLYKQFVLHALVTTLCKAYREYLVNLS